MISQCVSLVQLVVSCCWNVLGSVLEASGSFGLVLAGFFIVVSVSLIIMPLRGSHGFSAFGSRADDSKND